MDEYKTMEKSQGARCAVCQRPESAKSNKTGKTRRLAVDHDHATGEVRALVCLRCNLLVWALEDNHTTLTAIAVYIQAHREQFSRGVPDGL